MRSATRVISRARKSSPMAVACISVTYQGSSPFDVLDSRIRAAMDVAKVERLADGTFRASTPSLSPLYTEGTTRRAALSELWEEARWLLADPVKIAFEAEGRTFTAEVLAERRGGYSVTVPELPGCFTCGDTMDEVRKNVVEAAELCLESSASKAPDSNWNLVEHLSAGWLEVRPRRKPDSESPTREARIPRVIRNS